MASLSCGVFFISIRKLFLFQIVEYLGLRISHPLLRSHYHFLFLFFSLFFLAREAMVISK